MSKEDQIDLFNDPALKNQFNSLPEEEKAAYRSAGEYMYSKDYTSETPAVENAVEYIRTAFNSGMMPSQLTNDELEFLRNLYGPEWYTRFGFESETYSGMEKKTSKRRQLKARPSPIKMPVIEPFKVSEIVLEEEEQEDVEVASEEEDPENAEINYQSSYVYTVWS